MGRLRWWQIAPQTSFGLFVASVVVTYLIPKQTQWLPRPGMIAEPIALFPIPSYIWQTAGWLLLIALLAAMLTGSARDKTARWPDRSAPRLTILALAGMWAFALLARIVTGKTEEPSIGPFAVSAAAGLLFAGAVVAARPPRTTVLIGLLIAGGVVARLVGIASTELDQDYSDNLPAILVGLDRLVHGQTPYTIVDFGTHLNPMGYLPWTFLGYLPPFALGLDIRLTNLVLSLAVTLGVLLFLRRLALGPRGRAAMGLLAALVYAAPNAVGFDLYTEWQFFTLALTGAFALCTLGRLRLAAACFGAALGAMPLALFTAPAFVAYAARRGGLRELLTLTGIACAVASPVLMFLLWDPQAFFGAVTHAPLEFWHRLDIGDPSWPYLLAWHGLLLGRLRFVQLAIFVIIVIAAWRVRTPSDALPLAVGSYLGLALTGPFIAPHMFTPLPWLVLVTMATLWSRRLRHAEPADRVTRPDVARIGTVSNLG